MMPILDDVTIAKPTDFDGYITAAEQMLLGAEITHRDESIPLVVTHLCGHSIETSLKAILSVNGLDSDVLSKKPYGHDLIALWSKAVDMMAITIPVPDVLERLNKMHGHPYTSRYPLGFHGMSFPDQNDLILQTRTIFSVAAQSKSKL